ARRGQRSLCCQRVLPRRVARRAYERPCAACAATHPTDDKMAWSDVREAWLQIAATGLLVLDGFEQRFEVANPEPAAAFALDDLEKERGAIFNRLGENLQQIAFRVAVHQNAQLPNPLQLFINFANPRGEQIVIGIRHPQAIQLTLLELAD